MDPSMQQAENTQQNSNEEGLRRRSTTDNQSLTGERPLSKSLMDTNVPSEMDNSLTATDDHQKTTQVSPELARHGEGLSVSGGSGPSDVSNAALNNGSVKADLSTEALNGFSNSPEAQDVNRRSMTTSFSNPKVLENGTEGEKEPFISMDIEVQQPSMAAREKAKEAGVDIGEDESESESELDENEYWTDEEEEQDATYKKNMNIPARGVLAVQNAMKACYGKIAQLSKGYLLKIVVLMAFIAYFVRAMFYDHTSEGSHRLIVCTTLGVIIMTEEHLTRGISTYSKRLYGADQLTPEHAAIFSKVRVVIRWSLYIGLGVFMVYIMVNEGISKPTNLRGIPGLILFLLILVLFCPRPDMINWHTVYWSLSLQFICAAAMLKWETGREGVLYLQDRLEEFFKSTEKACSFLFGDTYLEHKFVFSSLPLILFVNATLNILYNLGAVQYFVKVVGRFLNFILDTSPAESTAVAIAMFMDGMTTALTMKEYLRYMSKSQLFLTFTAINASIGGALIGMMSQMGVKIEYMLAAMTISAPATFAVCKIMLPETKWSMEKDRGRQDRLATKKENKGEKSGVMDSVQSSSGTALSVVVSFLVMMFTFLSFIDWINSTLTWFGDRIGVEKLTIELISSYVLYPIALMMGVEPDDCRAVAMLLGYRFSLNTIFGFIKLQTLAANKRIFQRYMRMTNNLGPLSYDGDDIILVGLRNKTLEGGFITDRSEAIVTYSLCGFSSLMHVTVMIGVFCTLVPSRRKWILSMAFPALVAGNIANCMTGCFASLFY